MPCWRAAPAAASSSAPRTEPSCSKSNPDASLENLPHPRSRTSSGVPMDPRSPSCASTASSLPTASSSNCAASPTTSASRADAGMSHRPEAPAPNSSSTPPCTMSSTACHPETLEPSARWMRRCMPCVPSRTNSFAWIARLVLASSALIPPKHGSRWRWRTRSTAKSCTWSRTASSAVVPSLRTCSPRDSLKLPFTSSAIQRLDSALPWLVATSRLPWNRPSPWSSSPNLNVTFGASSAARPFARATTRSLR
mmetsp:Transcript_11249/g.32346  ORF Transcript_11249/g.32346 Transcript_11249/m.32346 type:complete len:252 (+) Transcript_11249:1573-2328(+)